ncbi:PH domain-containing protein [Catelliglobosispora koreensis]|uniref:PH domain-containing protein n=1 Tax=Catelliglobosispora koreensis TaxID=129052 RepID=UPI00035C3983|nr:PH domain-containing protein [Catelliglobosispora koreensis]
MAHTPTLRADIESARALLPNQGVAERGIRNLAASLHDDETVMRMLTGTYGNGTGLMVLTDQRLIFILHTIMTQQVVDFTYGKITSIQWSAGLVFGSITIFAPGNKAEIRNVRKDAGKSLVDIVRNRVHIAQNPPAASPAGPDAVGQLRKLAELKDLGILTPAEYAVTKASLITRI